MTRTITAFVVSTAPVASILHRVIMTHSTFGVIQADIAPTAYVVRLTASCIGVYCPNISSKTTIVIFTPQLFGADWISAPTSTTSAAIIKSTACPCAHEELVLEHAVIPGAEHPSELAWVYP